MKTVVYLGPVTCGDDDGGVDMTMTMVVVLMMMMILFYR